MGATESGAEPNTKRQPYRCFLVRCRLEEGAGPDREPAWRFTVEQAGDGGARRSFASLRDVTAHLEAELTSCAVGSRTKEPTEGENTWNTRGTPQTGRLVIVQAMPHRRKYAHPT